MGGEYLGTYLARHVEANRVTLQPTVVLIESWMIGVSPFHHFTLGPEIN